MSVVQALRGAAGLLLAVVSASVQAQHESRNVPVHVANRRVLVGTYRFEEDDGKIELSLKADGTASYVFEEKGGVMRLNGLWTHEGPFISIDGRATPVRLDPKQAPTRNAKVALSVAATLADGSPAEGLGVRWAGGGGLYRFRNGGHEAELTRGPITGDVDIVRIVDRRTVRTITLAPGGPNSFRFTYHPSEDAPFQVALMILDARAQVLEMEAGTASIQLRRVAAPAARVGGGVRKR